MVRDNYFYIVEENISNATCACDNWSSDFTNTFIAFDVFITYLQFGPV